MVSPVIIVVLCFASAASETVTPVEKVITLLEDLKTETVEEGKAEASTYDTFACFCKSTTESKAESIKTGQDNIEEYAATLQEQTSISNAKAHEIKELDASIATLDKEIAKITERREKEKTKYEASAADLSKAVSSLEGAIANMAAGMGFTQLKTSVRKSLLIADMLDIAPKHSRTVAAFLQEPDATAGMNTGSEDIVSLLEGLEKDFKGRKTQLDQIEGQNAQDFSDIIATKTGEKDTATTAKSTAEGEKSTADENIAQANDDMILEEAALKDDELYMKDLTERCELKAREWDQRSQMRAGEVKALTTAIEIITNRVANNEGANKRALLIQTDRLPQGATKSNLRDEAEESNLGDIDLSFLQAASSPRKQLSGLAKRVASKIVRDGSRRDRAIATLVEKAQKLQSPVLSLLAMKVGADPFLKVKKLVQELIERLVKEAAAESSKKGWCDTAMGKATSTRNTQMDFVMTLNGELMALEAKKASLEEEISTLTSELADLDDSLAKQTKLRTEEKEENMATLDQAKAGLAAVTDAYDVLKSFYKQAAKGAVSLVQASPVDEDAPASHSGAYQGGQQKAGGIFAMLDVIVSDFERTVRVVTESEKTAHAEFVEFDRATKTSIMSKDTGKTQAEQDLKETDQTITESMESLAQHQKLLDDSLKELEELKPTCVDTGMSYEERVAKREEEIDALKSAMCQLDAEGVEADC